MPLKRMYVRYHDVPQITMEDINPHTPCKRKDRGPTKSAPLEAFRKEELVTPSNLTLHA